MKFRRWLASGTLALAMTLVIALGVGLAQRPFERKR